MSKPVAVKVLLPPEEAIIAYKRLLQDVLNQRPSGTRQRLSDALGKHRSFVTQMTSPTYPTPIPQRHLPTILSVCHFTPEERDAFLAAYRKAHRGKLDLAEATPEHAPPQAAGARSWRRHAPTPNSTGPSASSSPAWPQ